MLNSDGSIGVTTSGQSVYVLVSDQAAFDAIKTDVVSETDLVRVKVVASGAVTVIFQFWKEAQG